MSGTGGIRPSSAVLPRKRAAVGRASLLRRDIDFLRSIVGRSGDASLLRAICAAGGGLGESSLTLGTLVESLRRRSDFLFADFEAVTGDWFWVSFSPATSAGLEIDSDFFFVGDGEREVGRENVAVQDLRFSLLARDEPLLNRGLAVLDDVGGVDAADGVGVVDPLLVSSTFSLASTRGSATSPVVSVSVSSDNFCRTIFGLFRNSAAKSGPESAEELSSRSSGVFQPDESGGEAAAAASDVLESTSGKLP